MDLEYLRIRKKYLIFGYKTQNISETKRNTLLLVLSKFNIGQVHYDEDDDDFGFIFSTNYNPVLNGILYSLDTGDIEDIKNIIHIEHIFWFGYLNIRDNINRDNIDDLSNNFKLILNEEYLEVFSDNATNVFLSNYLNLEKEGIQPQDLWFVRGLIVDDIEDLGMEIVIDSDFISLYDSGEPIIIIPFEEEESKKEQALYNIFYVLVKIISTL